MRNIVCFAENTIFTKKTYLVFCKEICYKNNFIERKSFYYAQFEFYIQKTANQKKSE